MWTNANHKSWKCPQVPDPAGQCFSPAPGARVRGSTPGISPHTHTQAGGAGVRPGEAVRPLWEDRPRQPAHETQQPHRVRQLFRDGPPPGLPMCAAAARGPGRGSPLLLISVLVGHFSRCGGWRRAGGLWVGSIRIVSPVWASHTWQVVSNRRPPPPRGGSRRSTPSESQTRQGTVAQPNGPCLRPSRSAGDEWPAV